MKIIRKTSVKTASFSLPASWFDRLENISKVAKEKELVVTKSKIMTEALRYYHTEIQKIERRLGIAPMDIKNLD